MSNLVSHSASILPANDILSLRDFYVNTLGFTEEFSWEDPPSYIVLSLGSFGLHLTKSDRIQPRRSPFVYVFVHDPDQLHALWKKRGAVKITNPENTDYGMRDFEVEDPEGNVLIIGKGSG